MKVFLFPCFHECSHECLGSMFPFSPTRTSQYCSPIPHSVINRLQAVSLFSQTLEQNARDTHMTTRLTEGARRSRLRALTKSEEKERLLAVQLLKLFVMFETCHIRGFEKDQRGQRGSQRFDLISGLFLHTERLSRALYHHQPAHDQFHLTKLQRVC